MEFYRAKQNMVWEIVETVKRCLNSLVNIYVGSVLHLQMSSRKHSAYVGMQISSRESIPPCITSPSYPMLRWR